MQGQIQAQKQQFRAMPLQIQASSILNMNLMELQQFVETEALENPALCTSDEPKCPVCGYTATGKSCPVCGASVVRTEDLATEKFSERDYLERAYAAANSDDSDFDPFRTVAAGIDLADYLHQQARMCLGGRQLRIAGYLIESLDDDGFFRESLFETAEEFAAAVPEIEDILKIVQSFDPPGIAARDLQECLLIQLRALCSDSASATVAEQILVDYWGDFSKMKLKGIARTMNVTLDIVREACEFLRDNLNPRPASAYCAAFSEFAPRSTAAVGPDVIIRAKDESLLAEVVDCHSRSLSIDSTYDEIYATIKDGAKHMSEDDIRHIREHVERARCILDAIGMRKKTIARVATYLMEYQKDFLLNGPSKLKPLRQKDVAAALEVHESTICRALAGKYCRIPSGEVIGFEVFFDSALPIRNLISQIIARSAEPLSDSEITRKLAENGVTIARRTVAKYRDQLGVLPCQFRAA